jgi:hypothetical protein
MPGSCSNGAPQTIVAAAPTRISKPGFLPTPPARFHVDVGVEVRRAFGRLRSAPTSAHSPVHARASMVGAIALRQPPIQGSPSVPQLALVMPTGSQRRAASARLNERKCRAPATTISAMTSCRPRCVELPWGRSGSATTACRRMPDKRQIQRVGCPFSRSKSSGCVLQ